MDERLAGGTHKSCVVPTIVSVTLTADPFAGRLFSAVTLKTDYGPISAHTYIHGYRYRLRQRSCP